MKTIGYPIQHFRLILFIVLCATFPTQTTLAAPLHNLSNKAGMNHSTEVNSLLVDGLEREYRLSLPQTINRTKGSGKKSGWPLVIVLHGTYGSGEKMQIGLGFDAYARQYGFAVAYPDAYRIAGERQTTRWNDGRGVLPSSELGVDDVAFISAMITDISKSHWIDHHRIFVTGASNGGIMTYRLASALGDQIRAIAPVIANVAEPLATDYQVRAGMSILSINGAQDPFIPLEGGQVCQGINPKLCEGGHVRSREESLAYFANANGLASVPASLRREPEVPDGTWVEELRYDGDNSSGIVRSLVVHGMGHVWPPLPGQVRSSGPTSRNLDATREIVEFFMSFE